MTELLTAAQMRAIEAAAIDSGRDTGLELMERAGRGVVDAVLAEWPELAEGTRRAVVLCGPGNNGGDGFVVARLLKDAGWEVEVFLYGDATKLPPDAKVNHKRWVETGQVHQGLSDVYEGDLRQRLFQAAVVIDALFGTGLTRPLGSIHNDIWQAFDCDTGAISRLVAVDIPSGLCADSGRAIGIGLEKYRGSGLSEHALQAELTVTFHAMKCGHVLADGPMLCGRVVVADIGLPSQREQPWRTDLVREVVAPSSGLMTKRSDGHKFGHGHALVLSGGPARTGAARLAARGALRAGAGLVTLGVPPSAQMEVAVHVTAVMIKRVEDAEALAGALEDARINALCLGPGLGVTDEAADLVSQALASGRPCMLDADALTLIGQSQSLFEKMHDGVVLTPHAGEFARVFPDIAEKLDAPANAGPAYSKVDAAREAAKRAGCAVLLKGADTVIASPSGRCAINASAYGRAAPWLATAGSGDVLAGFITGLLARGFPPHRAAETGAWLHTECALSFGAGLIAEDLPEEVPAVLRSLPF